MRPTRYRNGQASSISLVSGSLPGIHILDASFETGMNTANYLLQLGHCHPHRQEVSSRSE